MLTLKNLSDIRDEITESVRLIIEPKSRNLSPEMVMETLFKKTDLETKVSLNLNVIDEKNVPGVKSLKEALKCWLDHRQIILQRKSKHRQKLIENRINILNGYITVFLNLDKVIQIIREEDLSAYKAKGIYMRDDHCDWGSSGMEALVDQINDSN